MEHSLADDLNAIARIESVQKILEVVCRTTGLGFSAVARVTETHWTACAVRDEISFGLKPGGELKLETTICNEIREHGQIVAIDHVAEDQAYCKHPTPALYGFQSYISVPIMLADGQFFGTLCAIDPRPARVKTDTIINMFKLFADLIAMHLDAQDRVVASEAALITEREASRLREEFIAVLGHDLRNPLNAITSGMTYLKMLPRTPDADEVLDAIERSSTRMTGLIDDVLDFARGRLGSGISIRRTADVDVGAILDQVVAEIQMAWQPSNIQKSFSLGQRISCDTRRIAQLLSNLLANALTHGDAKRPICVESRTDATHFELSVGNCGDAIPPAVQRELFQPFTRGKARPGQQGLGLGLYIASEIARAHQGTLTVVSTDEETRFTFRMPLHAGVKTDR